MRRFGDCRVAAARRLVRALPDDLRLRTRRGLLDRLFDLRGDRDLRRAGMCVLLFYSSSAFQKIVRRPTKLVHHSGSEV